MPDIRPAVLRITGFILLLLAGCDDRYVRREEFESTVTELRGADARQHAQAEELRVALQQRISEHEIKLTELRRNRVRLDMVMHFDSGQTELREEQKRSLDEFASVVRERGPNTLITVEGFTDSAGSREYNRALGQMRADLVREYLIAAGLRAGQLRAISFGEDRRRQVVRNAPPEQAHLNRRVTVAIEFARE